MLHTHTRSNNNNKLQLMRWGETERGARGRGPLAMLDDRLCVLRFEARVCCWCRYARSVLACDHNCHGSQVPALQGFRLSGFQHCRAPGPQGSRALSAEHRAPHLGPGYPAPCRLSDRKP